MLWNNLPYVESLRKQDYETFYVYWVLMMVALCLSFLFCVFRVLFCTFEFILVTYFPRELSILPQFISFYTMNTLMTSASIFIYCLLNSLSYFSVGVCTHVRTCIWARVYIMTLSSISMASCSWVRLIRLGVSLSTEPFC